MIKYNPHVSIDYKFRYLLDDWQKEAVKVLNEKFREQLRATDEVLMDFADKAESSRIQNHFFDAQREIWLKMEDMSLDFHDLLTKSLRQFPRNTGKETPKLGSETLSLVNMDLYERNLALHTLAEKAERNNHQELYLLAQRLSVINQGQPVSIEQIPASPQQMCEVFARCVNRLTIENDALLVLYTLFDKYVLSALPALHHKLNQDLVKAGILPTLKYSVKHMPGSHRRPPRAQPRPPAEEGAPDEQTTEQLGDETMRRIHELLKANRQRRREQQIQPPPGVEVASPQEVIRVANEVSEQQAATFPDEETLYRPVGPEVVQNVQAEMHAQRKTIKEKVGAGRLLEDQEDIIDLVGLLFEQMLDEESIPNAVKALLGHLHTPYIKIGLSDETFFANADHPARVFLDKAIAASAIWVDEFDLKQGIYPFLKDTVFNIVRLRRQGRSDFEEYIKELDRETSTLEKKFEVVEKRSMEAEQGKEQVLQAKNVAKKTTAAIFGGHKVPSYCKKFIDDVWVDFLTLLQLRENFDTNTKTWKEAQQLGEAILATCISNAEGVGRAAQVEKLARQIHRQITSLLPHQGRKIDEFIEALYTRIGPADEIVTAYQPPQDGSRSSTTDPELEALQQKLRSLPSDTWFEFEAGTDRRYRAKLSWYNPLTDHFLFVTPKGKKSILLDINRLADQVRDGRAIYFTDVKGSFWNRAMRSIISMLERKGEAALADQT